MSDSKLVARPSDWDVWIPEIERIARQNGGIRIEVSKEEYQRLKDGGLEELKKRLSEEAAQQLSLGWNAFYYERWFVRVGHPHIK